MSLTLPQRSQHSSAAPDGGCGTADAGVRAFLGAGGTAGCRGSRGWFMSTGMMSQNGCRKPDAGAATDRSDNRALRQRTRIPISCCFPERALSMKLLRFVVAVTCALVFAAPAAAQRY